MADLAAKQAAQRAMIFIAKKKNKELQDHYELKDTGFDYTPEDQELIKKNTWDNVVILPREWLRPKMVAWSCPPEKGNNM